MIEFILGYLIGSINSKTEVKSSPCEWNASVLDAEILKLMRNDTK